MVVRKSLHQDIYRKKAVKRHDAGLFPVHRTTVRFYPIHQNPINLNPVHIRFIFYAVEHLIFHALSPAHKEISVAHPGCHIGIRTRKNIRAADHDALIFPAFLLHIGRKTAVSHKIKPFFGLHGPADHIQILAERQRRRLLLPAQNIPAEGVLRLCLFPVPGQIDKQRLLLLVRIAHGHFKRHIPARTQQGNAVDAPALRRLRSVRGVPERQRDFPERLGIIVSIL